MAPYTDTPTDAEDRAAPVALLRRRTRVPMAGPCSSSIWPSDNSSCARRCAGGDNGDDHARSI